VGTRLAVTAEDLLAMPDNGMHQELVRGEIVEVAPPGGVHGHMAVRIATSLMPFVKPQKLGVVAVETGYVLHRDPDTVRSPDVSFVRAERVPADGVPRTYWEGPPDLAVEVLSPGDRYGDVAAKVAEYLEAGTRLVWVVDSDARTVTVHAADRPPAVVSEADVLEGGDVLPGFRLTLAELFD